MQDLEKMTLFELRKAIIKEHIEYMRLIDEGTPINFEECKKRADALLQAINKKLREKNKN